MLNRNQETLLQYIKGNGLDDRRIVGLRQYTLADVALTALANCEEEKLVNPAGFLKQVEKITLMLVEEGKRQWEKSDVGWSEMEGVIVSCVKTVIQEMFTEFRQGKESVEIKR